MESKWIDENVDKMSYEELEKLETYSTGRGYSAVGGFVLGMFPQYTLMTHPKIAFYNEYGVVGRLRVVAVAIIPLILAYGCSRPYSYAYRKLIDELKQKYSSEFPIEPNKNNPTGST